MTCRGYTNEGQLGNQGRLQGLTATKLKVIPPLLDQLPVHTALQSVSQTLWLNCSRTSFCGFTLEVIAGISWQFFSSLNSWCVTRTGVIDCVHARHCEQLARHTAETLYFYFIIPTHIITKGIAGQCLIHIFILSISQRKYIIAGLIFSQGCE